MRAKVPISTSGRNWYVARGGSQPESVECRHRPRRGDAERTRHRVTAPASVHDDDRRSADLEEQPVDAGQRGVGTARHHGTAGAGLMEALDAAQHGKLIA